ncbi:hypothetical protein MACH07_21950 [Flagellimonas marinaquae]|uniref:Integrase n=1 Tax=Flagellimonas marinaquae TaxID=254955 RepID=A0AA48KNZ3_9FLAO|nr:hypothetical protein MACH07_21950 [Allomuricauda aquimarina]
METKFEDYLNEKGFTESTRSLYVFLTEKFLQYSKDKGIKKQQVDYRMVLKYVAHLKRTNNDRSVTSHLNALKHYFNAIGLPYNPIKINVRRTRTMVTTNTLNKSQLEKIYDEFPMKVSPTDVRNKVLMGLFMFQGIRSKEIKSLTTNCIDLIDGTITIPQGNKSNKRTLKLDHMQLKLMEQYVKSSRQAINPLVDDTLFVTQNGNNCIKGILNQVYPKLKKLPYRPTLELIRASVIKNWLKHYDLRAVQYMAGHRYISSTERYVQPDAEYLRGVIEQYHPIQ